MFSKLNINLMKRLLSTLFFIAVTMSFGFAQLSQKAIMSLPDETAVIRDSSGRHYDYHDWRVMVESGRFSLHGTTKAAPNSKYRHEFLIYALFDENGHRIFSAAMKSRRSAESDQFHPDDFFKPLKERDITGYKIDMKKMTGKVYVINFWYIGCSPCRAEIPDLNDVADRYKDNPDVVFIALCLDQTYQIEDYIKANPFKYHQVSDRRSLASSYGVHLYPTNLIVNRDGKVAYSSVGGQPSNSYWITKTVDEALQAPVPVTPHD